MSKVLVENTEDQTQTPFLRGILTRSLQKSGLTFDQAHEIANIIRDDIDDKPHGYNRRFRTSRRQAS